MRTAKNYVGKLQRAHEALIEENPVVITLHRSERVRDGGGFREVESTVGSVRARLYQEATGRTSTAIQGTDVIGDRQNDQRWALILPVKMQTPDENEIATELRAGSHVKETFECALGRFEITSVYPRQDLGVMWGWQADVVRIR